jgi:hypothetical protein
MLHPETRPRPAEETFEWDGVEMDARKIDKPRQRRDPGSRSGWLSALLLACAGLLVVAVAFAGGRSEEGWASPVFWAGLLIIYAPISFCLLGSRAGSRERLALVLGLVLLLYAMKVIQNPTGFAYHDELGQLQGANAVMQSGHLYLHNPIVKAYSYFPALDVATTSIASISGLSVFTSGLILIGVSRVILMSALFFFLARVTGSGRVAGIGALIYAANPNFVFFDAQFSYESLAIPLAMTTLLVTASAKGDSHEDRIPIAIAVLLAAGTILAHHLTSYFLVGALVIWAAAQCVERGFGLIRTSPVIWIAGFSLILNLLWWVLAGHEAGNQIGGVLSGAASGLWHVVTGAGGAKAPFTAAAGHPPPPLERYVGIASVAALLLLLPIGLFATYRSRFGRPALVVLGLAALAYPATLALRLTEAGTETSNRASEFVFLGLGAAIGLAFLLWVAPRMAPSGKRRTGRVWLVQAGLTALGALLFVGGITVGWTRDSVVPGGFQVGAGMRSVDAVGIEAARWARVHLPADSGMLADWTNKGLMAAYGGQDPQGGDIHGKPVGAIFLGSTLEPWQRTMIEEDKLTYLVVDSRLARELPVSGRYFDSGNPEVAHPRITASDLAKFAEVDGLQKIYSGGGLAIYDTSGLSRGGS